MCVGGGGGIVFQVSHTACFIVVFLIRVSRRCLSEKRSGSDVGKNFKIAFFSETVQVRSFTFVQVLVT